MKKFVYISGIFAISLFISSNTAQAQSSDDNDYDNAYYECAEQVGDEDSNYDQMFEECMKAKGLSVESDESEDHNHDSHEESDDQ